MRKEMAAFEANTLRKKVEFEADMGLLKEEKEAAAAEAEASALEHFDTGRSETKIQVPYQHPLIRSQEYVNSIDPSLYPEKQFEFRSPSKENEMAYKKHPIVTINSSCDVPKNAGHLNSASAKNSDTDVLTSFLLRKEMLPQRLQKFNEKPQSYLVWKKTFQSVMKEVKATPVEEIDILVNKLGPESQSWAESLRASNASNTERGLNRIWERLDHYYGSPEKIEMSLKSRIEKFPQLGNKDNKRLYDLSDLLLEVQSAKEDRQFALQFAVYDSSAGVNTIVQKLPYSLRQKWISHATKYKRDHAVVFPPFHVFVRFVQDMAKIRNDPAFQFEQHFAESTNKTRRGPAVGYKAGVMSRKTQLSDKSETYTEKPVVAGIPRCPIHRANHSLSECKTLTDKTWEEKRAFLREKGICFKCLSSTEHVSSGCRSSISCEKCRKGNHHTAMHRDYNQKFRDPHPVHGRENAINNVVSSCTSLCDQNFKGRSCGKIVLVNVTYSGISERVYAVIDDQSNRSLIGTELCDKLNVNAAFEDYTLSTCSGSTLMAGRQVAGLTVSSLDGSVNIKLPTVVECDAIPQDISEIPTPEVANNFSHLKKIARSIPPLENDCGIQLLIGRDLPAAHHVLDQILGPRDSPFALQLSLGWVIIGEICLGRVHQPESVHTYFTHIGKNGRGTIFSSCESYLKVKDPDFSSDDIFRTTPEDNKVGLSAEDRDFLKIMNDEFTKDDSGLWCAPLPFKSPKHTLLNIGSKLSSELIP